MAHRHPVWIRWPPHPRWSPADWLAMPFPGPDEGAYAAVRFLFEHFVRPGRLIERVRNGLGRCANGVLGVSYRGGGTGAYTQAVIVEVVVRAAVPPEDCVEILSIGNATNAHSLRRADAADRAEFHRGGCAHLGYGLFTRRLTRSAAQRPRGAGDSRSRGPRGLHIARLWNGSSSARSTGPTPKGGYPAVTSDLTRRLAGRPRRQSTKPLPRAVCRRAMGTRVLIRTNRPRPNP